jgi:hypothetical protein
MYSGTTEPSTGLISKCRVSNMNINPMVADIQKKISLKYFLNNIENAEKS